MKWPFASNLQNILKTCKVSRTWREYDDRMRTDNCHDANFVVVASDEKVGIMTTLGFQWNSRKCRYSGETCSSLFVRRYVKLLSEHDGWVWYWSAVWDSDQAKTCTCGARDENTRRITQRCHSRWFGAIRPHGNSSDNSTQHSDTIFMFS